MKRVLLTGASGFIGRRSWAPLVSRGFEVHAVDLNAVPGLQDGIYWHQGNLLNPQETARVVATIQPTHLLHFAWVVTPGKYVTAPENITWVQASLELLRAFAEHGGQRVVMAGTCMEYDWRYGYCSEAVTPLAPTTLYSSCKHALQLMLAAFARQMGLSAAWGRIFFLYGPHEYPERLVAYVIRSLLKGEPARCSSGEQTRDFMHVQDVADAFVALLDSDVTGPVNIGSGAPVSIREIILKIAALQNKPDLIQLGALPTRPDDPPLIVADVRRLHDEVKWRPAFTLQSGLESTIEWWKNQL